MTAFRDIVVPDIALRDQAAALEQLISQDGPLTLNAEDGTSAEVPPAIADLLAMLCKQLSNGSGVSVGSLPAKVPVIFAAHLMGISSQRVREHAAAGEFTISQVGPTDVIALRELVDYDKRADRRQRTALTNLVQLSERLEPGPAS